jgi:dihydrofolate synthase/folylpolyglutamate synthase
MLESILGAAGHRAGVYTSPHLLAYNERVRVAGREATDRELCAAFARVEAVRGDSELTYFEFGTLAALDLFRRADLDAMVLEVGLGGRLDAVNLLDPDVAVVTTVGLDHQDWLGPDRESIGREKAGIFRPGRPAVYGGADPPASLLGHARELGVRLHRLGQEFGHRLQGQTWTWWAGGRSVDGLPLPALAGAFQLDNAAAALMALDCLGARLPVTADALASGLASVRLPGRLQRLPGAVEWLLDVAHNPQAAQAVAAYLESHGVAGTTHALLAMLGDKDADGVIAALAPLVQSWHVAGLPGPRGAPAQRLLDALARAGIRGTGHAGVAEARCALQALARPGDRVLVLGSFLTVAEVLRGLEIAPPGQETAVDG